MANFAPKRDGNFPAKPECPDCTEWLNPKYRYLLRAATIRAAAIRRKFGSVGGGCAADTEGKRNTFYFPRSG